jgi:hypothetical protein
LFFVLAKVGLCRSTIRDSMLTAGMTVDGQDLAHHFNSPLQHQSVMPTDPPITKGGPASMPAHGQPLLEWDWTIEHADRKREARADSALHHHQHTFQVDRKVLKDVVREKMHTDVGRIKFLSSGKCLTSVLCDSLWS